MKKLILSIVVLCFVLGAAYLKLLPALVSNEIVINAVEKTVKKSLDIDVDINKPKLRTFLAPKIEFSVNEIKANKGSDKLVEIENLDIDLSFGTKKLIVNKFGADSVFVDADKLIPLAPKEQAEAKKTDWTLDLIGAELYLNKSLILYSPMKDTFVKLRADNINIDNNFIHFDINADIVNAGETIKISITDDNKVFIKDNKLTIDNCPLTINNSKVVLDAWADKNSDFEATVFAKKFLLADVIKFVPSEQLIFFDDLKGNFDFKIKLTKDNILGDVKINKIETKLIPLANLPVKLTSGDIKLEGENINLQNFKGIYAFDTKNTFDFNGSVKGADADIDMSAVLTDDFMRNYLSKLAGVNISLIGKINSKIAIEVKNNNIDVKMAGKVTKGDDILLEGTSLSPATYDRALTALIHIKGDNVNIETINYYIAKELNRETRGIKPILSLKGNVSAKDGRIFDMGFEIPNPLPSEFLNIFVGQKMFRKGKFWGDMNYVATGDVPVLEGELNAEGIAIPSQRLFLRKGSIKTDKNLVKLNAEGKFRRCGFDFDGDILNQLIFPVVVKNTSLVVDNVDIERLMKAFSAPVQTADYTKEEIDESDEAEALAFDIGNIIIENCILRVIDGKYKEITFANVAAKMSLDENSIFKLHSNRFEIAKGHSSADINCDLKNQKYNLRLGIKDVDSDLMSTAILNLPREISGKASGLIDLNTDESLKLNGNIKFIVKNGAIQKIGLVEYVLKFAALFRNPLAMISPSIFSDMVNIPEGNFDKITGDLHLKDNAIQLMKIKSYSSQLSAYIVGCYNLENSDAILRIYTKFSNKNKGFSGFLRNLSLNSLANRIPLNSRNDANYYAAELEQLPAIDADEKDCQIFLTKVDGDVEHNNFISSLKKIK